MEDGFSLWLQKFETRRAELQQKKWIALAEASSFIFTYIPAKNISNGILAKYIFITKVI